VQTDGYEGYERPCSRPGVVHVGCMAYVAARNMLRSGQISLPHMRTFHPSAT